jgi:hypothetical protein
MALRIERGRRQRPVRAGFYGIEGIGKSTLASQFPAPVILDTEDGTNHLDVARVAIGSWDELRQAVAEIGSSRTREFQTVVIDSADWAERLLIEHVCSEQKKKSIEDFGFGKGFVIVAEQFGRFLTLCDSLVGTGTNVVFVAHSKVQRTSPPDITDGYDRYELKMSKQVSPLLKEWCDLLAFCTYKTQTTEGSDGRTKAVGGKRRVMHVERAAAWDAKNRYGLDAELPMTIEALAPIFAPEPAKKPSIREQIAAATSVEQLGDIGNLVDDMESEGRLPADKAEQARGLIAARHDQIQPKAVEVEA